MNRYTDALRPGWSAARPGRGRVVRAGAPAGSAGGGTNWEAARRPGPPTAMRRSGLRRGHNRAAPAPRAHELTTGRAAAIWGDHPEIQQAAEPQFGTEVGLDAAAERVLAGEHAGQLQEDPGHPEPRVTEERGERAQPPQ